jgi:hypothetical protein
VCVVCSFHSCSLCNWPLGCWVSMQTMRIELLACGSVLGWGTMLQAGRSPVQVQDFSSWSHSSGRTMALSSTQPLTEMSTRNFRGGKGRSPRKDDNLTAICKPIVQKMWEPRRLTNLWAFTACYRSSFTITIIIIIIIIVVNRSVGWLLIGC